MSTLAQAIALLERAELELSISSTTYGEHVHKEIIAFLAEQRRRTTFGPLAGCSGSGASKTRDKAAAPVEDRENRSGPTNDLREGES